MLERRPRKAGRWRQIFCFITISKPALEPNTFLTPSPLPRHKKILLHSHFYMLSNYKYFTCKSMYCALVFAFSGSNSCSRINYFCHTAWQDSKLKMYCTLFQFFISIWPDVICCQRNACSVMPCGARSNKLTSHLQSSPTCLFTHRRL